MTPNAYGQPILAYGGCSTHMLEFFQYQLFIAQFFVGFRYAIELLNLQFEVVWPCYYMLLLKDFIACKA